MNVLKKRLSFLDAPLLAKIDALETSIRRFRRAAIGFSGGVDSTFLAWACREILGASNVLLITADSPTYPAFELEEARSLAATLGLALRIIATHEMDNPAFCVNPANRCYYCKHELFTNIKAIVLEQGYDGMFEGGNASDRNDLRPGRMAINELGVVSPLDEAGLTKDEIRRASAAAGLSTASKPSYACLASRFPYGETITPEKLARVETAENRLRELGFGQFRVRSHGSVARLEFAPAEMDRAWSMRREIGEICASVGFIYAAIDTKGYRTGAMNEAIGAAVSNYQPKSTMANIELCISKSRPPDLE